MGLGLGLGCGFELGLGLGLGLVLRLGLPFAAPERAPVRVWVGWRLRPAAATCGGEGADGVLVPQQHAPQLHVLEEPKGLSWGGKGR